MRGVSPLRLGPRAIPPAAATVALAGVLDLAFGLRWDFPALGPWVGWGLSIAQLAVAAVVLRLALRQASPGDEPPLAAG